MSSLEDLELQLAEHLEIIKEIDECLKIDPENEEYVLTKAEVLGQKNAVTSQIADLKAAALKAEEHYADAVPPPPPQSLDEPPPPPKFDMTKHPKFRKDGLAELSATTSEAPTSPATFNVSDLVQARFDEDRQWYKAKIISKTGSSQNPTFIVNFVEYNQTQSTHKEDVRPLFDPRKQNVKRKADGTPVATPPTAPAPPTPSANLAGVITKAPSIDPSLVVKKEPSKVSDGPTREKPQKNKLHGQKKQEETKNNWQNFQGSFGKKRGGGAGGLGSKVGKDSMFRTPDLPGAKGELCCRLTTPSSDLRLLWLISFRT